jgi:hypothetical protein
MKLKSLTVALCLIAGNQLTMAQLKVAELVKKWERSKVYTKEYLDAIPIVLFRVLPIFRTKFLNFDQLGAYNYLYQIPLSLF